MTEMKTSISVINKTLDKEWIGSDRIDFIMSYLEDRHKILEALYLRELESKV